MQLDSELLELFKRYATEYTDFIGIDLVEANQKGMGDDSPLHVAARMGLINDVILLLKHEADINACGDIGLTPLHYAAANGHINALKLLIKEGANINSKDEFGKTPLDWAKSESRMEVVDFLREKGAVAG